MKSMKGKLEIREMIRDIEDDILCDRHDDSMVFGQDDIENCGEGLILLRESEKRGALKTLAWVLEVVVPDKIKSKEPSEKLQKFGLENPVR